MSKPAMEYMTTMYGKTAEEELGRLSTLWVLGTIVHFAFPPKEKVAQTLERLYIVRIDETLAYAKSTDDDPQLEPTPTWWRGAREEGGIAFYRACAVGLTQWNLIINWLEQTQGFDGQEGERSGWFVTY